MGKFTVELPFEIGQGIWARTTVNGEEVDTLVTVKDYTIDEFGVEISIQVPGVAYTKWFHRWIYKRAEIRFIQGRLKFGNSVNSAPFPSMICIFGSKGKEAQE